MNRKDLMPAQSCATCAMPDLKKCSQLFALSGPDAWVVCPDWKLSRAEFFDACFDIDADAEALLVNFVRAKGCAA